MLEVGSRLLVEYRRECVRRRLAASSIDKRMSVLVRTELSVGRPLVEATVEELRRWLDGRRTSARTQYAYVSHLAAFYRWAILEEHATVDPTLRIVRPRVRVGLPRPIATHDLEILIEQASSSSLRAMLYLGAHAGLRCMEIAGLDGPDVMFHHDPPVIVVVHGKGGKQRVIPIGPALLTALAAHGVPRSGPVFRRPDGDRHPAWQVSQLLRAHMHGCGVDASAHQLRHAFATAVYRRSGGDLRMTQELLGHSSPSTTAIYTAWSQERAAVVVKDLFGLTNP